ncbi:MAG: 5-demethoxyubiquinol-8 5-hydroxylase UbiM [Methylotenera sp.]
MLDLLIIGAGPAGLCLAKLLSGQGYNIGIVERQALGTLANPTDDGREIALTQHSFALLDQMGVTYYLSPDEYSALHAAKVLNGKSEYALYFSPTSEKNNLGIMVSNHTIRKGLFQVVKGLADVKIMSDSSLLSVEPHPNHLTISTTSGVVIKTRLLIGADSRFSSTRRLMGIGATMTDFGRSMLVCRMAHTMPHHHIAYEIFNYEQTLALLPLANNCSSVVLTLPTPEIEKLLHLDVQDFTADIHNRLNGRLGDISLVSNRFAYPLVATYAKQFIGNRFALIGDAAVGMHPVTAHGFNLGLLGAETLTKQISKTKDIGNASALAHYERIHKRATLPLFLSTNAIAKLYADNRIPARFIRNAGLRLANKAKPLKRKIVSQLMQV